MKVVFFKSKNGWRWRALARNGKIVASSAEAYRSFSDASRGLHVAAKILHDSPVEVQEKSRK